MKRLIMLCAFAAGVATTIYAQKLKESEVPASVKLSFAKKFPLVKSVTWSRESVTELEAEFEIGETEKSATFDKKGKWLGTETEIKPGDLPKAVRDAIARDFTDFKIAEPEMIETLETSASYEVEMKKNNTTYEVRFSSDGKVISKTEKKHN